MVTGQESFVVAGTRRVIEALRWLAILEHVERRVGCLWTHRFVDWCVIGCVAASLVSYMVIAIFPSPLSILFRILSVICLVLGASRLIDITTYQAVLLLRPPVVQNDWQKAGPPTKNEDREGYDIFSAQRSTVLLIFNYAEIILWFSTLYLLLGHYKYLEIKGPSAISVLKESIGLMVSNTSDTFEYRSALAWIAVTIHSAIGLFMTVVVAARVISTLPELKEKQP